MIGVLALSAAVLSVNEICQATGWEYRNCEGTTPFPTTSCNDVEPNVRWDHNNKDCAGKGITQTTWVDPQCWYPHPPNTSSVVEFYTDDFATFTMNTLNTTHDGPADFTVRGIVVRNSVTLVITGVVQVKEIFDINPTAIVQLLSLGNPYTAPITYLADGGQSALGLLSCKDIPYGFYTRICGPGIMDVSGTLLIEDSGNMTASVFAPVVVSDGGHVVNKAFMWGRTTIMPYGRVDMIRFYSHSLIMVYAKASLDLNLGWFDGWALNEHHHHENILGRSVTNCGSVKLDDTMTTNYLYTDCGEPSCAGTYNATVYSYPSGTVSVSGRNSWSVVGGSVTTLPSNKHNESVVLTNFRENRETMEIRHPTKLQQGLINYGRLVIKSSLEIVSGDLVNFGEVIIEGRLSVRGSLINRPGGIVVDGGKLGHIENQIVNRGKMSLRSGKPTNGIVNTNALTIEMFKAEMITNDNGTLTVLSGASISHLVSRGSAATTIVSDTTLFINTYHCVDCTTSLIGNATVYIIPGAPAPKGILKSMNNIQHTTASPGICATDDSGHEVCGGCMYPPSFDHAPCKTEGGQPGTFSYPDDNVCYACDSMSLSGATSEMLKKVIGSKPRETVALSIEDEQDLSDIEIRSLHLRNARIVSPDSTGKFIATTTTYIEGKVSTQGMKMYFVSEHNSPAILGGGNFVVSKKSLISISIEAYIGGGGHLVVTDGSTLDISSHATVAVRNHSVTITKTGSLHINGKLQFSDASNIKFCGITNGFGKLDIKPSSYNDNC